MTETMNTDITPIANGHRRKQAEIPGFERQVENHAVEEAAAKYCKVRDERAAFSKKEKQAQLELEATMHAHSVDRYEYIDDDGEVLVARIVIGATKAVVEKTGEAESQIGEGLLGGDEDGDPSLLAQARKAQSDANVEENSDGDVVVPEKSSPKAKPKKRSKRKGQ